jgi:hypothetical protein
MPTAVLSEQRPEKNAKEIFAKVMTLFVVAASLLWVVVSLFIDMAAAFEFAAGRSLIARQFLPGLIVVPIILLAYLFNGIYVNLWAGIYIEEKTRYFPDHRRRGPGRGHLGTGLAVLAGYLVMAAGLFFSRDFSHRYEYGKFQDPEHDRGGRILLFRIPRHLTSPSRSLRSVCHTLLVLRVVEKEISARVKIPFCAG